MGIQDIDKIIRKWVEINVGNDDADGRRMTPQRPKRIETDWKKVRFATTSSWFEEEEEEAGEDIPRYPVYLPAFPTVRIPKPNPKPPLVFKSNYTNETENDQIHIFNMKRSTESRVLTKMSQGFSRDGIVGIKIGDPEEVSNKTGNFGSEIAVEGVDANTVKHTMTWGMNSKVNVAARKKTVAELRVTEEDYECDFGARISIRGRIIARVFDVVTGKMKIVEGDIATVLKNERDHGRFTPDNNIKFQGNKLTWQVAGKLKFKFGVSQCIEVWNEELPQNTDTNK